MSSSKITFNSSSRSSASSATSVQDVIKKWGTQPIISCVVGISSLNNILENISNNVAHTALLLVDKKAEEDDDRGTGILIEYGDYAPSMSSEEQKYVDKELVVYPYKDEGGVRYYAKEYTKFIQEFSDIGYIDMDIEDYDQISFTDFLEKCVPLYEKKWIKAKYSALNHNCQHFVAQALEILKPAYSSRFIYPGPKKTAPKKKEIIIPQPILNILKK